MEKFILFIVMLICFACTNTVEQQIDDLYIKRGYPAEWQKKLINADSLVDVNIEKIRDILSNEAEPPEFYQNKDLELKKIGTVKNEFTTFHLIEVVLIWGSSGRATSRLVVLSKNWHYLGEYAIVLEEPYFLTNNTLLFPDVEQKWGNIIYFTNEYPESNVYFYGETYGFGFEIKKK
ncbi:MAG TPA: hypothetical protein DC049_15880 [Spirochaetia bacterium]|nr:hypothetical protein [Spirochaetia bacterium]